jgi:hypothetical protein
VERTVARRLRIRSIEAPSEFYLILRTKTWGLGQNGNEMMGVVFSTLVAVGVGGLWQKTNLESITLPS